MKPLHIHHVRAAEEDPDDRPGRDGRPCLLRTPRDDPVAVRQDAQSRLVRRARIFGTLRPHSPRHQGRQRHRPSRSSGVRCQGGVCGQGAVGGRGCGIRHAARGRGLQMQLRHGGPGHGGRGPQGRKDMRSGDHRTGRSSGRDGHRRRRMYRQGQHRAPRVPVIERGRPVPGCHRHRSRKGDACIGMRRQDRGGPVHRGCGQLVHGAEPGCPEIPYDQQEAHRGGTAACQHPAPPRSRRMPVHRAVPGEVRHNRGMRRRRRIGEGRLQGLRARCVSSAWRLRRFDPF